MTGTAATESTEFESIYKLKVTIVPTNKPMIRKVSYGLASICDFLTMMLVISWEEGVVIRNLHYRNSYW